MCWLIGCLEILKYSGPCIPYLIPASRWGAVVFLILLLHLFQQMKAAFPTPTSFPTPSSYHTIWLRYYPASGVRRRATAYEAMAWHSKKTVFWIYLPLQTNYLLYRLSIAVAVLTAANIYSHPNFILQIKFFPKTLKMRYMYSWGTYHLFASVKPQGL